MTVETPASEQPSVTDIISKGAFSMPEENETQSYAIEERPPELPFGKAPIEEIVKEPIAEAPKTETPKVEEPKEAPKEDPLAPKFSALTKKEKELRQLREEMDRREKDLSERGKKYEAMEAFAKGDVSKIKDLAAVAGRTPEELYSELTKYFINDQQEAPERKYKSLEEKLAAVEKELSESKEEKLRIKEKESQQRIMSAIDAEAKESGHELITTFGWQQMVYDVINKEYKETGEVPSLSAAAEKVEKYLEQQVQGFSKSQKFRSLLMDAPLEPKQPKTENEQQQTITPPVPIKKEITLRNSDSGVSAPVRRADGQLLDRESSLEDLARNFPVWVQD